MRCKVVKNENEVTQASNTIFRMFGEQKYQVLLMTLKEKWVIITLWKFKDIDSYYMYNRTQ